jgi:acylphosphatase
MENTWSTTSMARLKATVFGQVQGVFFRARAQQKAKELGLVGYAKNLPSGQEVECIAEGEKAALEAFLEWLKIGPPGSSVQKATFSFEKPTGEFSSFSIRG